MKITAIRLRHLEGILEHEGEFWEERLARPVDLYPDYWDFPHFTEPVKIGEGRFRVEAVYVHLETDEGVTGLAGPITRTEAFLIDRHLKPVALREDPLAVEAVWDKLYRYAYHARKGLLMHAISALDCALWDLRGRWAGAPVYRLLGGPTRDTIPAYASAYGFSLEPEAIRVRVKGFIQEGFRATKWFFRYGPAAGEEGIRRNLAMVRTVREAAGEEMDIMADAWMSWDVPYTIAMAERLSDLRLRWLEEPVLPDKIESYARIRKAIRIPVAGGEHEYTRWGFQALIEAEALDILQPDIYWTGGLTEAVKICALASAHDLQVIPHGLSVPASVQLIAAQPPNVCPLLEYLVKFNEVRQFFEKDPIRPKGGVVTLPKEPGLGVTLDEAKIYAERDLSWS